MAFDLGDFFIAIRLVALSQSNYSVSYQALLQFQSGITLPRFEGVTYPPQILQGQGQGQGQGQSPGHWQGQGKGQGQGQDNRGGQNQVQGQGEGQGLALGQAQGQAQLPSQSTPMNNYQQNNAPSTPMQHPGLARQLSGSFTPTSPRKVVQGMHAAVPATPPSLRQATPTSRQTSPSPWEMTSAQKGAYLGYFGRADKDGDGFVGGIEAQQFFSSSRLDANTLARIWQLADIDKDNQLNEEEFAIAMHLVFCVRDKQLEPPAALPSVLNYSLSQVTPEMDPFHGVQNDPAAALTVLTPTPEEQEALIKAEQQQVGQQPYTPRGLRRHSSNQQESARKKALETEAEVELRRKEIEAEAERRRQEVQAEMERRRKEVEKELLRQQKEKEEAERVAAAEQKELEELWALVEAERIKEQELLDEDATLSASAAQFTEELADVERATEVANAELEAVTTALRECQEEQVTLKEKDDEATVDLDDLDEQNRSYIQRLTHTYRRTDMNTQIHTHARTHTNTHTHTQHTYTHTHAYTHTHTHIHTRTYEHTHTHTHHTHTHMHTQGY
jgi:hypothetical protein